MPKYSHPIPRRDHLICPSHPPALSCDLLSALAARWGRGSREYGPPPPASLSCSLERLGSESGFKARSGLAVLATKGQSGYGVGQGAARVGVGEVRDASGVLLDRRGVETGACVNTCQTRKRARGHMSGSCMQTHLRIAGQARELCRERTHCTENARGRGLWRQKTHAPRHWR
eukprot:2993205-Rhodomonas_salina.3